MGNTNISKKTDNELIKIMHKKEKWHETHIAAKQELERRKKKSASLRFWILLIISLIGVIIALIFHTK